MFRYIRFLAGGFGSVIEAMKRVENRLFVGQDTCVLVEFESVVMRFLKMNKIFEIENKLVKLEKALLAGLVMFMVLMSFLQVVLRVTASKSILWLDPLLRYFVLWAGFLGASLAIVNNKHFALDVITKSLKPKAAVLVDRISVLFTSLICTILLISAIKFVKSEIDFDTKLFSIGSWQVSALYMEFMIPLGFGLIIFHSLAGFFKSTQLPSPKGKQNTHLPQVEGDFGK